MTTISARFASALLLASSIAHAQAPRAAVYPDPGFGHGGCYAGRGLEWGPSQGAPRGRPVKSTLAGGPFLVIDSAPPSSMTNPWEARVIERSDSGWTVSQMNVMLVDKDSVQIVAYSVAPTYWRMARQKGDLRGTGWMVHDSYYRRKGDTTPAPTTDWPIWLVPVPCAQVPLDAIKPAADSSASSMNVMNMPVVCDSAPLDRRGPVARLPDVTGSPAAGRARVIGMVREYGNNTRVWGASVTATPIVPGGRPANGPPWMHAENADSTGAFLLDQLDPGRYEVSARFISLRSHADTVELRAGVTDTLVFSLRYVRCNGY
jgi:hypothetical protein